jgi:hypothetical protein
MDHIINQAREHPYVICSFTMIVETPPNARRSCLTRLNHCPRFIRIFKLAGNIDSVTLSSPFFRTLATQW